MRYRFLDCTLDSERRELRRAGEFVPLRPRVFQLLLHLLEQRDRAVSKTELFERLWPRRIVSDATLNSCIKELRKAVGDTGDTQRVIQTLHGHGFRFVARLVPEHPSAEAPPPALRGPPLEGAREPGNGADTHAVPREYKQVSVLVCSIADAESHAVRLGAEAMDELMQSLLDTARAVIERYGGIICEWSGSGFSALFGAPIALEDHGRRAVQAAMDLLTSVARRGAEDSVRVRMGLNTGAVVVGQLAADPHRIYTAVGDTTWRASRIHDCALPGTLLASDASYHLVEADTEAEPAEPVEQSPTWRIRSVKVRRGGVPQRVVRRRSRFVGRERELDLLRQGLRQADAGRGNAICIVGEPGIGKSRLLDEFRALASGGASVFQADAHCLAHQTTTPYFPIVNLLRQLCGILDSDGIEAIAAKVAEALRTARIASSDARPLLLELLDVPVEAQLLAELGPEARRARSFSYLTQLIVSRAMRDVCVLTLEDLHWIDATSEALLDQLIARVEAFRLLIIVTCRPGYRPPWSTSSAVTQLALRRLSEAESADLIASVPRSPPLQQAVARQIITSAEGNPFFLEELTWTLAHDGSLPGNRVAVPSTVQAVIAARIDQLPATDKRLLQIAAAIGSRIDERLLHAVSEYDASSFSTSIHNLQSREFLYETVTVPVCEYRFRHALTQDVAYQSLLSGTRGHYHQRIAEILERDFPDTTSSQPGVLAQHWAAANRFERAFGYWQRAGVRASERSANQEAVEHLKHALEMNDRLERTPERMRARLEVLLALGPPLMATRGFAAPEVDADYTEAGELCRQVGTPRQRFTAAWGFWLHNIHRGRVALAKALVKEILELTARIDDRDCWLQAHHAGWSMDLTHGDLESCRQHAEQGIRLYDRARHHAQAYLYGIHDPGLCARGTAAAAAWFLGRPDEALRLATDTLELARELTHPYSWLLALGDMLSVRCLRREFAEGYRIACELIEVCAQQHVPNYLAYAGVERGWTVAMLGELDAGIDEMSRSLAAYRALGLERHCIRFLTMLADALRARGLIQEGLDAVAEAERLLTTTEEIRWAPEVHRMRGRLLLARSPAEGPAAESSFRAAVAEARAQGAVSFEVRAATDLARLYVSDQRSSQGRELLVPLLARIAEGSGLPDLNDARQVLESCAAGARLRPASNDRCRR
jgi:DNA-binding winged helix-turn-helix (wHTH) protein/predicted ATPase